MKRSPIKPMSDKRKAEMIKRKQVMEAVRKRDNYCCQAKALMPNVSCYGPLDGHEIVPRGVGGDFLDIDMVVLVCRQHHSYLHDNPIEATSVGLLRTLKQYQEDKVNGVRLPVVSNSKSPVF